MYIDTYSTHTICIECEWYYRSTVEIRNSLHFIHMKMEFSYPYRSLQSKLQKLTEFQWRLDLNEIQKSDLLYKVELRL